METTCHVAVIGGGIAGTHAALAARELGASVVLVRRSEQILSRRTEGWAAVHTLRHWARSAREGGARNDEAARPSRSVLPQCSDWTARQRRVHAQLRNTLGLDRLAAAGIDVRTGTGRFVAPDILEVDSRRIRFWRAIIATGVSPATPAVTGIEQVECLSSQNLGGLSDVPACVAVIGTDGAACQLAQALTRLGSEVHLLGTGSSILEELDPDVRQMLQAQLLGEGIRVHLQCNEIAVGKTGNRPVLTLQRAELREKLFVDAIVVDGPVEPNLLDLELPAAGVRCDAEGLLLDEHLRTSNRRIYAAGEVCNRSFASLQSAEMSGRLAAHNAMHWRKRAYGQLAVPFCIHTDPQIAQVGISAEEARRLVPAVRTCVCTLDEAGVAAVREDQSGLMRLHVEACRGRLLGATIVAADAAELIGPLVFLMNRRLPVAALRDLVPCHPSRLEILRRLASECGQSVPRRWIGRWQSLLLRLSGSAPTAPRHSASDVGLGTEEPASWRLPEGETQAEEASSARPK